MLVFFTNPWVIGISTGILSGLIVFFITNKLFARKANKEYIQRINLANNELIYGIRPLIVEQKLPALEILDSTFRATAKKYSVKIEDLMSKEDIADYLIKEIIENSFLNAERKLEFCLFTGQLKNLKIQKSNGEILIDNYSSLVDQYQKHAANKSLSYLLSLMTGLMSLLSVLMTLKEGDIFDIFNNDEARWLPINAFIITIIPFISLTILHLLERIRKYKKKMGNKFNSED